VFKHKETVKMITVDSDTSNSS